MSCKDSSSKVLTVFRAHHIRSLQLQNLLQGFKKPVRVEVSSVEPADHPNKTAIMFMTFDVSQTEHLLLSAQEQLEYIRLLNDSNINITDSGIYWDSE